MKQTMDPITLAVVRNNLISAAKEMKQVVMRTSFTTVIYEVGDFSVGLVDRNGGAMAQAPGLALFLGNIAPGVKSCVKVIGEENIEPGDIITATSPIFTGMHAPDAIIFSPIFYQDKLFGYACARAHWIDLGAKDPYPTDSTNVFEEGLRIPPLRLYKRGVLQTEIKDIIQWNSRLPEELWGDLLAQVAACRAAEKQVTTLLDKYGLECVSACIEEIYNQSESITRAAIEKMPDGTWTYEDFMDDNGVEKDKPVKIKVTVTIKGSDMIIDFTGSAEEQKGPINCPIITTECGAKIALACLISEAFGPDFSVNEGCFRPLKVIAPEGCVLNPGPLAPTFLFGWPAIASVDIITRALAPAMPEKVPAYSGGDICGVGHAGVNLETGKYWIELPPQAVGQGASAFSDGQSAMMIVAEGESRNVPVEVEESRDPVIIERYELDQDSGGPGKYRGGLGHKRDYRLLYPGTISGVIERGKFPHWGLFGGKPGRRNYCLVHTKAKGEFEILKSPWFEIDKGDGYSNRPGGGGGYGDPLERDIEAVCQDVINEYVSVESAKKDYGVVIDPHTFEIDTEATKKLRRTAKKELRT